MKIDFNNVRRRALASYSGLVRTLKDRTEDGQVKVSLWEIESDMENLRSALVGIALTHEPGNAEFADVLGDGEIVPSLFDEEEDDHDPE